MKVAARVKIPQHENDNIRAGRLPSSRSSLLGCIPATQASRYCINRSHAQHIPDEERACRGTVSPQELVYFVLRPSCKLRPRDIHRWLGWCRGTYRV